jgi:hypothetical protein
MFIHKGHVENVSAVGPSTSQDDTATSQPDTADLPPPGPPLLQLQRQFGNRYVQRLLTTAAFPPAFKAVPLQTKMVLGLPGDRYEQEAECIAREVNQPGWSSNGRIPFSSPQLRKPPVASIPLEIETAIRQARGGGRTLPALLQSSMGKAFGADFSQVRIHEDTGADSLARNLKARAFTTGQDIFFRRGEYSPATPPGQSLLAHELTHVVQQNGRALKHNPENSTLEKPFSKISRLSSSLMLIQAAFWERTADGKYIWHGEDDDPDPQFFEKTKEMKAGQGAKKKYPVYVRLQQRKENSKLTKTSRGKAGQDSTSSTAPGWNADAWDVDTMMEAAGKLIERNNVGTRIKAKLESSLKALEDNKSDSLMMDRMKTFLNEAARSGAPSPIDTGKQEAQAEKAQAEKETAEQALELLSAADPSQTKKYRLKPQSFPVDKSGSAVERLRAKNDKVRPWTGPFIESLKEGKNLFRKLVEQGPLFYGTTEGQRIHVLAARFLKDKQIENVEPVELMEEVTNELVSGAKETWPEVSNFWLAGTQAEGIGLVGERYTGVKARAAKEPYKLVQLYAEDIKLLQQILDLRAGANEQSLNVKQAFIQQFHAEQAALGKDWFKDVERADYQHKPGHDSSKGSQENETLMFEDLICRRMCKWMLHLAHYNDQPVIYSLDEIDLSSVSETKTLEIKDTVSNSGKLKLKVPVCTSELRQIFREADKFDRDEPNRGVKFFQELMPVPAPWDISRGPEAVKPWAEYALHLTRKILINYPGDELALKCARGMLAAFETQNWPEIITLYKMLQPSVLVYEGVTISKRERSTGEARKEMEKTRKGQGTNLSEVPKIVDELTERILSLNQSKEESKRPAGSSEQTVSPLEQQVKQLGKISLSQLKNLAVGNPIDALSVWTKFDAPQAKIFVEANPWIIKYLSESDLKRVMDN